MMSEYIFKSSEFDMEMMFIYCRWLQAQGRADALEEQVLEREATKSLTIETCILRKSLLYEEITYYINNSITIFRGCAGCCWPRLPRAEGI